MLMLSEDMFAGRCTMAARSAMLGIPPAAMSIDWNHVHIQRPCLSKGIYGRENVLKTWYKMGQHAAERDSTSSRSSRITTASTIFEPAFPADGNPASPGKGHFCIGP